MHHTPTRRPYRHFSRRPDSSLTGPASRGGEWAALLACCALPATAQESATNRPAPTTFTVRTYQVDGNTALPKERVDKVFTPYTGTNISIDQVLQAVKDFQLEYRDLGYATVGVTLPRQKITNETVRVQVTEGRLADIVVLGNTHFSSNNVRRALPSLNTNVLLNSKWFQAELDQANLNQDRQIYPVISPGPDPGTSALQLKVKDRLPLHGHLELNNRATPGTPPLRIDSNLQYNNLWQRDHQVGVQYTTAVPDLKEENQSPRFFDQPQVASYSGFYRIPISRGQSLREKYEQLPVDFGYDPVSHSFRLPAPTGGLEWIAYASRSTSETPVRLGPETIITSQQLAEVSAQSAQRDLTVNENLGTKLTVPLPTLLGFKPAFQFGIDYKGFRMDSFSTNLTRFSLYSVDDSGTNRTLLTNSVVPLANSSIASVYYLPLSIGFSAIRPDKRGTTAFNLSQNIFLSPLDSDRSRFQSLTGSKDAGGNFTTVSAGLTRDQVLGGGWSALFRANGQWASAPLISNEQFGLGGTAGVRGYQEGEEYGDSGWRSLFDLRAPPLSVGFLPLSEGDIPVNLRCSAFIDCGERYLLNASSVRHGRESMLGTGLSVYATIGQKVDARLTLGFPLLDTPGSSAGTTRVYFSLGAQF
ncbi:MAG TPA: POTRA domain-containing protein [Candidatus Limnocylindria bacterium]|nr:POTRA domain-containing protein [Candidatus Limnocylindria bacterium]